MAHKTNKIYWDTEWENVDLPPAINLQRGILANPVYKQFDNFFTSVFSDTVQPEIKLLEIGCAASVWLPYFANKFGFSVAGIDYSRRGCFLAESILVREGVTGEVVCADFFDPPANMLGKFDVVVSFGVAEHFEPTGKVLTAFSNFLKPGGMIITAVPNMVGCIGVIQKLINRPIFDIHVPITRDELTKAHLISGFSVMSCRYFLASDFAVNNLNGLPKNLSYHLKSILLKLAVSVSKGIWFIENIVGELPATKFFSPYVICVAQRNKIKDKLQ